MNESLSDPAFWGRLQFGFTLIYHYLFPQPAMGWAGFLCIGNGVQLIPERKNTIEPSGV